MARCDVYDVSPPHFSQVLLHKAWNPGSVLLGADRNNTETIRVSTLGSNCEARPKRNAISKSVDYWLFAGTLFLAKILQFFRIISKTVLR
jgi:hypothetical protein